MSLPTAPSIRKAKREHSADNLLLKATLLLTSTLTVMAAATVSPALPAIQMAFQDFPNVELLTRLVLTLPALFIVFGAPLAGYIVDRFGRKRLLFFSALLYAIGGSSGLYAASMPELLIGRAFLGLAVAGLMTSVTTLIADYYEGETRSTFLGLQAAFMGLGGVVFLSLGGALAEIGWRFPFMIYLLALLLLPLIAFQLYEPARIVVSKREETTAEGAVTARHFRGFLIFSYVTMAAVQIVFYMIPVQLPFYLHDLVSDSAALAGLAIAAMSLFYSLASASFGWVNRRLHHVNTLVLAFGLIAAGYLLLSQADQWSSVLIGLLLSGTGLGLSVPNLNAWLAGEAPAALRGRALGGLTTALFLGQFLSPLIAQPIIQTTGDGGVYLVMGMVTLVGMLAVIMLRKGINGLAQHQ